MKQTVLPAILAILILLPGTACHSPRKSGKKAPSGNKEYSIQDLAESNNRFALDLFRQIHTGTENVIYSPYSISNILAMVYGGAFGRTAEEMGNVLYFPTDQVRVHAAQKALTESLASVDSTPGTVMKVANAVWAQEDFKFLPAYFEMAGSYYKAPLELLDFQDPERREKSRLTINNWVEKNTNNKIRELIQQGILDANTRMVLTNAIYFNGKWKYPFAKDASAPSVFHVSQEESMKTIFMHQTKTIPYYEDEEVQAISLPYRGGRMSMLIILPKTIDGWGIVSRLLDYERIRVLTTQLAEAEVQVSLPRFKSELKMNLGKELIAMGMKDAFSRDADLSGMTGEENLFIDEVIHEAVIEVSEAGTEAAAASAAVIALKSSLGAQPEKFNADHPFVYYLRDEVSGTMIFAGRLVRPSEIE